MSIPQFIVSPSFPSHRHDIVKKSRRRRTNTRCTASSIWARSTTLTTGWLCRALVCYSSQIIAVFQCQEFPPDDTPPRHLYMVVSESVFLLLEPDEKRKNVCTLTVCVALYALEKMERDLDMPNKIIFFWHRSEQKVRPSVIQNRICSNKNCMLRRRIIVSATYSHRRKNWAASPSE